MSHGLQHVHKRKNSYLRPSENTPLKKWFDDASYLVAFIGPLSSIDQLLQIWTQKSAEGVSVIFWVILLLTSIFWMIYGIVHNARAILVSHILWTGLSAGILALIFLFS